MPLVLERIPSPWTSPFLMPVFVLAPWNPVRLHFSSAALPHVHQRPLHWLLTPLSLAVSRLPVDENIRRRRSSEQPLGIRGLKVVLVVNV